VFAALVGAIIWNLFTWDPRHDHEVITGSGRRGR
jgi:hypothetical protein